MLTMLLAALLASAVVSVAVGTVTIPLDRVWAVVVAQVGGTPVAPLDQQIVWTIRVPRVLLAAVVGAALALTGTVLQALVRNPLADPYVLGISSGSSLGAVAVMGLGAGLGSTIGVTGGAFAGAVAATAAVFVLAQRSGRLTDTRLILAGVAVGYLAMAGTSLVQLWVDPSSLRGILFWLMGSVAGAEWADLGIPALIMLCSGSWMLLQARNLNALVGGDDDATALGVDIVRLRIALLLTSSLLIATSVAVAGAVGFVGLMVPHAARLVVGADHRRLLPTATLTGATFLVLVDLATRTVDRPNEYPITVFTAALGAPFFLWLLRRSPER